MKLLTIFNNKGGVGKTTLLYHLAYALSEMGKKVLLIDLDSQCNLTLYGLDIESLHRIWEKEDVFFDESYEYGKASMTKGSFAKFIGENHTIHFLLKPTEDGTGEPSLLSEPVQLAENLDLIPGRLSLYSYEDIIAKRWNDIYAGHPLAIRTFTRIRDIARQYSTEKGYDFVLIDTSPSLGALNKTIIMNADGFIIPALPDMFSLYGIRNIGKSLTQWKNELNSIFALVSDVKRKEFPEETVQFLGYTIYNAKKAKSQKKETWGLARAHYDYATQIPQAIRENIPKESIKVLCSEDISNPIGELAVMHSHNTYPSVAQKYRVPIWKVPDCELEDEDKSTIGGNRQRFYDTKEAYHSFAADFLRRVDVLGDD